MVPFIPRSSAKSAVHRLKTPFSDVYAFQAVVQSFILKNPFGCTSYMSTRKSHPPVEKIREMYTAKFLYMNPKGKRIGYGLDMYDSVDGYENGIAAIISNMANIASHRGTVKHIKAADLFSVTLKCHDPEGELYFLSIARDRVTLSSYQDDAIRKRVEMWTDSVPVLE